MMKISLIQANFTVGALESNSKKLLDMYGEVSHSCDIAILPELGILGYPPEDLLFSNEFKQKAMDFQNDIVANTKGKKAALLFGGIYEDEGLYNVAIYAQNGEVKQIVKKSSLPNYGVFDEKRFFKSEAIHQVIDLKGLKFLVLICEDLWAEDLLLKIRKLNFEGVFIINASPYTTKKLAKRVALAQVIAKEFEVPVFYNNLVGGQDSLVFDGHSFVLNQKAKLVKLLSGFREEVVTIDNLESEDELPEDLSQTYQALMLGLKDYLAKNGAKSALIGLSGGMDSALCAVIACDALGPDNVHLIKMPSRFTSEDSFTDANKLIDNLECKNIEEIAIEELKDKFLSILQPSFKGSKGGLTEENLQARIRGVILMALSNKFSHMVIATSNKSEAAMGYATLYGDMCGAYSLIKDVYKTQIYSLAVWRNLHVPEGSLSEALNPMPSNIIKKAPTAELRDNQKDSDSLPEYEILDGILEQLIEGRKSVSEIIALGYQRKDVEKANSLLRISEYKRYQASPGPKISDLSFDKERRIPLTNHFSNE